ncbi:class I SAM-dependent methyltransferase [Halosimplex halobium]|uniref:class I SAM-dependent methyltransferase n=1 Tax=Halosimplex halobium TaxID=3396618 RepID=UPI003F56E691
MPGPFAQALYDHHFGEQSGPLRYRNGEEIEEPGVEIYFDEAAPEPDDWLPAHLDGPLVDLGAGAGRHALAFQERHGTVAVERSDLLVEVMEDRGVRDARRADMFALREHFERDRFRSALAVGTQTSLARSMRGLRAFLGDLAYVTAPDGTAVIDGFDPDHERTRGKLDYYEDPSDGLAYRVMQLEYDGTLSEPWLYRLFSPDRVREATAGTGWRVADVRYGDDGWDHLFEVTLEKR